MTLVRLKPSNAQTKSNMRHILSPDDWQVEPSAAYPLQESDFFEYQTYNEPRRKREGRLKKMLSMLNGIGMVLGIVGIVGILAPYVAIFGTITYMAASSSTAAFLGSIFGFFKIAYKIDKENAAEKLAIADVNATFIESQLRLLRDIQKADQIFNARLNNYIMRAGLKNKEYLLEKASFKEKWDAFNHYIKESKPKILQAEFEELISAADYINRAVQSLRLFKFNGDISREFSIDYKNHDSSSQQVTLNQFNNKVAYIKQNYAGDYQAVLSNADGSTDRNPHQDRINRIVDNAQKARISQRDTKLHEMGTLVSNHPLSVKPTWWQNVKAKFGKLSDMANPMAGGMGLTFGLGSIAAGIFFLSNPYGWVALGIIVGACALGGLIVGGLQYYSDYKLKQNQEKNMQNLGILKNVLMHRNITNLQSSIELQTFYQPQENAKQQLVNSSYKHSSALDEEKIRNRELSQELEKINRARIAVATKPPKAAIGRHSLFTHGEDRKGVAIKPLLPRGRF